MTPDLIERLRSVVGWWHKPTGNVFSAADYRDLKPKWQSRFPLADMDADFVPLVSALIPVEPVPTPREAELEAALPVAFITCNSEAPKYYVTIKTQTLADAQAWHRAVLARARIGRGS